MFLCGLGDPTHPRNPLFSHTQIMEEASEYNQEIPQSHTTDQPMTP